MALSTITARVDDNDKALFDSFCSSVGLTSSAAINMYVKAVIRERRIPFEIRQDDPFFSEKNQEYVMKSVTELRNGGGAAHDLIEEAKELNDEQIEMMIEYARFLKYKAANHDVMQKKEEAENWLFNELENGRLSGEENGWIPLSDAVERHLGDMA